MWEEGCERGDADVASEAVDNEEDLDLMDEGDREA